MYRESRIGVCSLPIVLILLFDSQSSELRCNLGSRDGTPNAVLDGVSCQLLSSQFDDRCMGCSSCHTIILYILPAEPWHNHCIIQEPLIAHRPDTTMLNIALRVLALTGLCAPVLSSFVLLPLYIYPSPTAWAPVYDAVQNNPTVKFQIVVNPNSGPGAYPPDASYIDGVSKLNSYPNVLTIGYVATTYGQRPYANGKCLASLLETQNRPTTAPFWSTNTVLSRDIRIPTDQFVLQSRRISMRTLNGRTTQPKISGTLVLPLYSLICFALSLWYVSYGHAAKLTPSRRAASPASSLTRSPRAPTPATRRTCATRPRKQHTSLLLSEPV